MTKKKHAVSIATPLSQKKAQQIERVYELVRAMCEELNVPLDRKRGEQHFVTEVIKYALLVDKQYVDLPFNPELPTSARMLTVRQQKLVWDVIYVVAHEVKPLPANIVGQISHLNNAALDSPEPLMLMTYLTVRLKRTKKLAKLRRTMMRRRAKKRSQ